MMGVLPR